MKVSQLSELFHDLRENLALSDLDTNLIVRWAAQRIAFRTQSRRVAIRCVFRQTRESALGPRSHVFGGDSSEETHSLPTSAAELTFFGTPAVLGDVREKTHTIFHGPKRDADGELAEGEICLSARLCTDRAIWWVLIFGDSSLEQPERIGEWLDALSIVIAHLTHKLSPLSPPQMRRRFYNDLVSYAPSSPERDFRHFCQAWRAVSHADWSWLWLYNPLTRTFELSASAAREAGQEGPLPPSREAPGNGGLGDYVCATGRPERVDDVAAWRKNLKGVEYQVLMAKSFLSLDAPVCDCIPLFEPRSSKSRSEPTYAGVISLHYRRRESRTPHDPRLLLTMGRLTALCIQHAKEHEQHSILVQLNRIAQKHLSVARTRPRETRRSYLEDLIRLIRTNLNVGCCSIFFRHPFDDAVECIASTGLETTSGEPIPEERLSSVVYAANERNTGSCYATSQAVLRTKDTDHLYREIRNPKVKGDMNPAIYMPIPNPASLGTSTSRALGVIRCFEHKSYMFPDSLSNFDPTEVETLEFIAEQIGPILQVFEQRILRERNISIVKHDLSAPNVMMRDTIDKLLRDQEEGRKSDPYYLRDLQITARRIRSLVEQLDPDPGSIREFSPRPTFLEGDIVARLKDMMSHYAHEERDIKIEFDGFSEVPRLRIDPLLVERALYNLLDNAIKYGRRGSTIRVDARVSSDRPAYCVDVSNYGVGVETSEAPFLFTAGYRSPRVAGTAMGIGLGLSIAKTAMKRNGGDLFLTRAKDPTIFTLYFPEKLKD